MQLTILWVFRRIEINHRKKKKKKNFMKKFANTKKNVRWKIE